MIDYRDKKFLDVITHSINRKKLILFVGAGFSKLCGLPLWNELANKLLDAVVNNESVDFDQAQKSLLTSSITDPRELVSIAYNYMKEAGQEKVFFEKMRGFLSVDEAKESETVIHQKDALREFVKRTNATVVTTNADIVLDDLFDEDAIVIGKTAISNYSYQAEKPTLIHLHGSINDPGSLIFTTDRYLRWYTDESVRGMIRNLFYSIPGSTILFVGYGFSELQLLDFMVNPKTEEVNCQNRFALEGFYSYQENVYKAVDQYYSVYGLKTISFSKDKKGFGGLIDALEFIRERAEVATDLRGRAFVEAGALLKKPATKANKKSMSRYLSRLKPSDLAGILDRSSSSPYAADWIRFLMDDPFAKEELSVSKIQPGKKTENGIAPVDCPLTRILSEAYVKHKSDDLLELSKEILPTIFARYDEDEDLFTNYQPIIQILKWIFCSPVLANMPESIAFVEKSAMHQFFPGNWMGVFLYGPQTLMAMSKQAILRYTKLAISSGEKEGYSSNYFDKFMKTYGTVLANQYPEEIYSICFSYFSQKTKERFYFFDESKDPFWDIKIIGTNTYNRFDSLIAGFIAAAVDYMSDEQAMSFYGKLPNTPYLFKTLRIYFWNSHFLSFKNEMFKTKGSFLNDRRLFSEFYGLLKKHVFDMSVTEIGEVVGWIEKMAIDNHSNFYNAVCQLYLLDLVLMSNVNNESRKRASDLKNEIISSFSPEERVETKNFIIPQNISKNIWLEDSRDLSGERNERKKELLSLDNESFLSSMNKTNESDIDDYAFMDAIPSFFDKHRTLEWLSENDYQNLKRLPPRFFGATISYLFRPETPIVLEDALEFINRCLPLAKGKDREKLIDTTLRELYFSFGKKYKREKDPIDSIFDFAKKFFSEKEMEWNPKGRLSVSSNQDLLSSNGFFLIGILAKTTSKKNLVEFKNLIAGCFEDEMKTQVAKAAFVGHIGYCWTLDQNWTSSLAPEAFDNEVDGKNISFYGFSVSLYGAPSFVQFIEQNGILKRMMNSKEFDSIGYYFGNLILQEYLLGQIGEDAPIVVLRSEEGISSYGVFNDYVLRYKPENILNNVSGFKRLLAEISENGLGGGLQTGRIIEQLIQLNGILPLKDEIIEAICKLSMNWETVSTEDIVTAISRSDFDNGERMKIVAALIEGMEDAYLFLDEIVTLFDLVDWSDSENEFYRLQNLVADLNPTAYEKIKIKK